MQRVRNNFVRDAVLAELKTKPQGVLMALPDSLADALGVTRRSVERTLALLEAEGYVQWTRKTRGGAHRPFYLVTVLKQLNDEVSV